MKLNKIVLGYYGVLFLAFGLVGLTKPQMIADLVHLSFTSDMGYLDFVAMYGGLFLGIGGFMLYCLKSNVKTGLVCVLFTMGAMFITRLYKYLTIGEADLIQYTYLGGELFTVVLVTGLIMMSKPKPDATPTSND